MPYPTIIFDPIIRNIITCCIDVLSICYCSSTLNPLPQILVSKLRTLVQIVRALHSAALIAKRKLVQRTMRTNVNLWI